MGLAPTFRTDGDTKAAALTAAQDPLMLVTERIELDPIPRTV